MLALLLAATSAGLAAPGSLDTGFNPNVNNTALSLAVQADGKVVLGGGFNTVGGVTRSAMARLNADGTLDTGFNPNANNLVYSTAVQADGKLVVGGVFTTMGGVTRNRIARVNADGTLDTGFNPNANNPVNSTTVQTDGRLVIGGFFTTVGGVTRNRIARLNADGTRDTGFNPDADGAVASTAVQADGRVVIGGSFTFVGGVLRNRLARLNADGSLDIGFNPNADGQVLCLAVQADGKIVIGGSFTAVGGVTRNRIARLNADGTVDPGFNPGADNDVYSVAVQADGRLVVGGYFTTVGGVTRNYIARLDADGTLDSGFNPEPNNHVHSVAVQADGRLVIGGLFTTVGGVTRNGVARLENDAATQSLTVSSSNRVQWLRGGASPETVQVSFELSTNGGGSWTPLGDGTRISGGWELTGLSLPASGQVRARARTTGGYCNGSSGLVEAVASIPEPAISVQPQSQTIASGSNATFSVTAIGTAPFDYQWRSNGVALASATNSSFTLTNVPSAASGSQYTVVITNAFGSVTSSVAVLTVLTPPVIISQPRSATVFVGRTAFFSVTANGTTSLSYQWRKDGVNISGATNALLLLAIGQTNQAGSYNVAVTDSVGSVTSSNATLSVRTTANETVAAWGGNGYGQTTGPAGLTGIVAIVGGGYHTAALKSDGTVLAWGYNFYGQTNVPAGLSGVVAIAASGDGDHTVALKNDGTVVVWGDTRYGQTPVPAGLSGVVAVAAGWWHSVALKSDGKVVAWGYNSDGQTTVPAGLSGVVAIGAGSKHSVALKGDGTVVAWGTGYSGSANTPPGLSGVTAIATGRDHNLALKNDGTVVMWGDTVDGTTNLPAGLTGVVGIAAGAIHNVAMKSDGTVVAWGYNRNGGTTGTPNEGGFPYYASTANPVTLSGEVVSGVTAIAAGGFHTMAFTTNVPLPIKVLVDGYFVSSGTVARPDQAVVSLRTSLTNASLYYSRDGSAPFIGGPLPYTNAFTITNSTTIRALAVNLNDFSSVPGEPVSITIIPTYALTLTTAGGGTVAKSPSSASYLSNSVVTVTATPDAGWTFLYWTGDTNGFTGGMAGSAGATNAITMNRARSVQAVFGTTLSTSIVGSGTVQLSPTNGPYAYGSVVRLTPRPAVGHYFSLWGNAGSGSSNPLDFTVTTPNRTVSALFTALGAGQVNLYVDVVGNGSVTRSPSLNVYTAGQTVTLTASNTVINRFDGWTGDSTSTTNVISLLLDVSKSVTASFSPVPVGTVVAWGAGKTSTGIDPQHGQSIVPTDLSGVTAIAAGGWHTVALKSDGTMVAWGRNTIGQTAVPPSLSGVTAVAAGFSLTLALKTDGTVVAWGDSGSGQTTVPGGLNGVTAIAAGANHSLALKGDGTVVVWGGNTSGQTNIPAGLSGVTAIAAGSLHTVALKSDGTVVAWGDNGSGQTTVPAGLSGVTAVKAGHSHSVALKSDGTVVAWGAGGAGQLNVPSDLRGVTALAAGYGHTVALKSDGTVVAWGDAGSGQTTVPLGLSGVTAIAAGGYHTVALIGDARGPVPPSILTQTLGQTVTAGSNVTFSVAAAGSSPFSYQWRSNTVSIANATNASVTMTNVQTSFAASYSVVITNAYGAITSSPAVLTVLLGQAITFGTLPNRTAVDAPFAVTATASSGLPVTLSVVSGPISLAGNTVTLLGTGSVTLRATQAGDATYAPAAPVEQTFTVAKADQTITFAAPPDKQLGDPPFSLSATASSGLAVSFSLVSGPASLSGSTLTLTNGGVVMVRAAQTGNANYNAAPNVDRSFTVSTNTPPVVTLTAPTNGQFYLAPAMVAFTATASDADGTIVRTEFYLGGTLIASVTNQPPATPVTNSATATNVTAGTYTASAVAVDNGGARTTNSVGVTVYPPPTIQVNVLGTGTVTNNPAQAIYTYGESVTLTATPGRYYAFSRWSDNVATSDRTITVDVTNVFTAIFTNTVPLETNSLGGFTRIAPVGTPVVLVDGLYSPGNAFTVGNSAAVTVQTTFPSASLYYSTDGSTPTIGGPRLYSGAFTVTNDVVIRALAVNLADSFATNLADAVSITVVPAYALTLTTAGGGTVAKTASASSYLSNSVVTVTATPDAGWTFLGWTGDTNGFTGGTASAAGATNAITMNRARSVQAVFGTTLTTSTPAGGGTIQLSPAGGVYAFGSVVRLTARPNAGFYFNLWGGHASGSSSPLDFTVTQPARAVSALFTALSGGQVSLTVEVVGNGSVTRSPALNVFTAGQTVTLTAVTLPVRRFDGWSGDTTATTNVLSLLLDVSKSVTASFSPVPPGTVVAWGDNGDGQTTVPAGLSGVTAIAGGLFHTVALKSDGTVLAWGRNDEGQTIVPGGLGGVTGIAAGLYFTVALKGDGTVVAWGDSRYGQTTIPGGLNQVRSVGAGEAHAVAVKLDGTLVAWGDNSYSQTIVPAGVNGVAAIAVGAAHTVALKNNGTVTAWGNNTDGQASVPAGLSGVTAVAAGQSHTVALRGDGTVVAWGLNSSGQTNVPAGLSGVTAVAAGFGHTLALKGDGTVVAWGRSSEGQTNVPAGLGSVTSIAGGGVHSLAVIGSVTGEPVLLGQPQNQTAVSGTNVTFTVNAAGAAPLAFQWLRNGTNVPGATNASLVFASVTTNDAGGYRLVVTNELGSVTSAVATLTVRLAQVVTFNALPGRTFLDAPFTLTASATSPLPVTFSVVSGPASVSGNQLTLLGAGSVTVRAAQTGDATFAPAFADQTFAVAKAGQTIAFNALPNRALGDPPFALSATASSSQPVSFSVFSGPATVSGGSLTMTGGGVVTVRAAQVGNTNYNAAPNVDRAFTVLTNTPPMVTLTGPADRQSYLPGTSVALSATATDTDGVAVVEFYARNLLIAASANTLIGADATAPYSVMWSTNVAGLYELTAQAVDTLGARATSAPVQVRLQSQAPLVNLISPTNLSVFALPTNITLTASAADLDGFDTLVARVDFLADSAVIGTVLNPASTTVSFIWTNPPPGQHSLKAVARDAVDLSAESGAILITVNYPAGTLPTFSFAQPVYRVDETNPVVVLTVLKNQSNGGRVNFRTVDGTARAVVGNTPGDYVATNGFLEFLAGDPQKTITVAIRPDPVFEGEQSFTVLLESPDLNTVIVTNPATATVIINDREDPAPTTNSVTEVLLPATVPAANALGALQVSVLTTNRPDIGTINVGQWRLLWDTVWHNHGEVLGQLQPGSYEIVFQPRDGFVTPSNLVAQVNPGPGLSVTGLYSATTVLQTGSLRVDLSPNSAQWRVQGEPGWRASGATVPGLVAGPYVVEFTDGPAGFLRPSPKDVRVFSNFTSTVAFTYPAGSTTWNLGVVNSNRLDAETPYAYTGQLLSESGYGSGTAVRPRVVLTAGHLAFNDRTLTFATNIYWFHRRYADRYEPRPQQPRGSYVFAGYDAQRGRDNSPGVSSPDSQHLDAAALFFYEEAAAGGQSGYLVSDAGTSWLARSEDKLLTGYPLGAPAPLAGQRRPQAVEPGGVSLIPVEGAAGVFKTAAFLSTGGNSGGPVSVKFNTVYYPAGIYLGGTGQSVVRAIDADVADLINRANLTANTGDNNTEGGEVNYPTFGVYQTGGGIGGLTVTLGGLPAGAGWRLVPPEGAAGAFVTDANTVTQRFVTLANLLEFAPVAGHLTPGRVYAPVSRDGTQTVSVVYARASNFLNYATSRPGPEGFLFEVRASSFGRYVVYGRVDLGTGAWVPLVTNTLDAQGRHTYTNPPGTPYRFFYTGYVTNQ